MRSAHALVLLLLLAATLTVGEAFAQRKAASGPKDIADTPAKPAVSKPAISKPASKPKAVKNARLPGITPGREAAVMTFVRENHPELEALLVYLKENRPADFEKAFRDLFSVSERLARIQEQDEQRYELELARWKVQSRIQLLAARLRMENSEVLREQIREALDQQFELQIAILKRDRERLAERIEKLDAKIERLGENKQQELDRQFRVLTVNPEKRRAPAGGAANAGAKDKAENASRTKGDSRSE